MPPDWGASPLQLPVRWLANQQLRLGNSAEIPDVRKCPNVRCEISKGAPVKGPLSLAVPAI